MGHPVPLLDEPVSGTMTVFYVQSFWRDRRKLSAGRLRQYRDRDAALTAARALSERDAGVIAFAMTGNPTVDYWEEPRLLAAFGDVPELTS